MVYSDDDGLTWSFPREITKMVKRPQHVTSIAVGPGVGIQIRRGKYKGRIIMPFNQGPWGHWKVYAAYSDDLGKTWKYGDTAPRIEKGHGNEVQVVELSDSTIMLNTRTQDAGKCRGTAYSFDGGQTWSPIKNDANLIDPQCQGSIVRYTDPLDGRQSRIIFSNPCSSKKRVNGTVYLSYDEGKTYPVKKIIYPDSFAYSCLTVLDDLTIGCLFERDGYSKVTFTRFTLDWLTDGSDSIELCRQQANGANNLY
jgi:sialidase-1